MPDRLPRLDARPFHLRAFEAGDLTLVAEASSDREIPLVSSVPWPFSEEAGHEFIERQQRLAVDGVGYSFVVADDEGDSGAGSIGLWLRDIDLGRAAVGYWVVASRRGRGVAATALGRLSRWALLDLGIPRLELAIEPWNVASIRTAERAGYVLEGLLRSWVPMGDQRRDVYLFSQVPGDLSFTARSGSITGQSVPIPHPLPTFAA